MRPHGITVRILLPIVAFVIMLAVFSALRTRVLIDSITDDYHNAILLNERKEVDEIINRGLPEEQFLPAIRDHLTAENFIYRVKKGDRVVLSCCSFPEGYRLSPSGTITALSQDGSYYGFNVEAKKYGFVIEALREFPNLTNFKKQLNSTVTVFFLA